MSYYQRDQLSIKSNKILGNLFAQLILLSQKVQSFRQILVSVPYYDCIQLFRVLDRGEKGFLRISDFFSLIGQDHKKVVTYAFGWLDQAKLGEVSRLQFISFLMPRRNDELREMTARRIQQPVKDDNYSQTINEQLRIFTELLNQMISHELKIIEQRKLLLKQSDYSIKGVLNSLDLNVHQFVSTIDILKFLQNYAIQATKQQIEDLLEIVDSRLTGKITLQQLTWIVEGLENKNKNYLKKVLKSNKNKPLRNKNVEVQPQEQNTKQFMRTPLKSTSQNYHQSSINHSRNYQTDQKNNAQISRLKESNYNTNQIEKSRNNQLDQQNQQNKAKKQKPSHLNSNFDTILQRYKQAEKQAKQRDAQLIKTEQQMKDKLRDEFNKKSNSRRRVLTQTDSMVYQSRRKQEIPHQEQRDYIKNDYRSSSVLSRVNPPYQPWILSYQQPYTSQYDKRINTIVENFYKRNADSSSDITRKYGTISNSFNDRKQRSISSSYNRSLYDKNQLSHNKFLEDELYGNRTRVKPFDHKPNLLKQEINKKLGDDIFNIELSNRNYNRLAHQARQRPLEESIKRLKESSYRVEPKSGKISQLPPKMMENISIISRETPKITVTAAKPNYTDKQSNIYRTDVKARTSSPSSAYQSVANGQMTKNRGLHTTETRHPTVQTGSKIIPSPMKYQRRQL